MIIDTIDGSLLIYVSGVPSDTRSTLVDYLKPEDYWDETAPNKFLVDIEHSAFEHGYVTDFMPGLMKCQSGKQVKTLMYPQAIECGIVNIIADYREEQGY